MMFKYVIKLFSIRYGVMAWIVVISWTYSCPSNKWSTRFSFNNSNEKVKPKGEYKVDLQNKWCDCERFRVLHLPCSHVIAACSSFCHDYKTFVDNKFTNECVYAVYNIHFDVVHHQTYWPHYVGLKVVPNNSMHRAKKGRPPITCIRTKMEDVETERR